jgi:hypothetical protein
MWNGYQKKLYYGKGQYIARIYPVMEFASSNRTGAGYNKI